MSLSELVCRFRKRSSRFNGGGLSRDTTAGSVQQFQLGCGTVYDSAIENIECVAAA